MIDFGFPDPIDTIAANEGMYAGGEKEHYFAVGRSALKNILHAINIAEHKNQNSILDLPCGHGRVLRYLRAKFPNASLTACDIDRDGVDFCVETFNVKGVYSEIIRTSKLFSVWKRAGTITRTLSHAFGFHDILRRSCRAAVENCKECFYAWS